MHICYVQDVAPSITREEFLDLVMVSLFFKCSKRIEITKFEENVE